MKKSSLDYAEIAGIRLTLNNVQSKINAEQRHDLEVVKQYLEERLKYLEDKWEKERLMLDEDLKELASAKGLTIAEYLKQEAKKLLKG